MHPLIAKHILLPLHEKIIGRGTLRYLDELEHSQWWSVDQLRDLQQEKLRKLLRHAYARCPFYSRRIAAAGLDPTRATLEDLPRLPTLTKSDIAEHCHELTDPNTPGGLHRLTTGGSTGAPLAFYVDRSRQAADQAARARTRRWFGIDIGQRELYLWGSPVEQAAQDRLKRLRDAVTNHRLLNAFKMTPSQMSRYLDEIQRFDPVHLFGYPSSIARLVRYAVECGRPIRNRSLKAVFVTGELFLPADRAVIEEHIGVPVADGYGSREAGFIAQQCPAGSYHVTMESLIVELIDAAGRPVAPGDAGEIVVTHLDAFGMPFIRYRTGDVARTLLCREGEAPAEASGYSENRPPEPSGTGKQGLPVSWRAVPRTNKVCPCHPASCSCGRGLECLQIIEGRRTDMLRTAAGGFAHALSVIYVLRDEPAVREFKIIQRSNLDLDVFVVPRHEGDFDAARARHVVAMLKRQIGERIDVRLHLVSEIESDPSGKHRYVVSEA